MLQYSYSSKELAGCFLPKGLRASLDALGHAWRQEASKVLGLGTLRSPPLLGLVGSGLSFVNWESFACSVAEATSCNADFPEPA